MTALHGNSEPTSLVTVDWECDLQSDEQTQEMLGLGEGDIEVIMNDPDRLEGYKSQVATLFGVPQIVDMAILLKDPRNCSDDQITDALSDEFGWLVNGWSWNDK